MHFIGFPLCAPEMMRLLTMSARGRPRRPESWPRPRSGDMKSRGWRSGVRQKGEEPDRRSASTVLSTIVFLPGVSGVSVTSAQNPSDLGVE